MYRPLLHTDSYTTDLRMRGYQTVHDTSTARSLIAPKDDEVIRDAEDNLLDPYTYSAQSLIEVTRHAHPDTGGSLLPTVLEGDR